MVIELKNLTLVNFKGIRSLSVDFDQVTNIYGINGTGKTTVMDGFLWALFGKDSSDRKDFEIKTLDDQNHAYHHLDHEVGATLSVDAETIRIRRVYKEKWVKKRGDLEAVFAGHETLFYWNEVPMKLEEYQAKVSAILQEGVFKLITNTTYFNSLKWQERRNVLLQIAGRIDDTEVLDRIATIQNKSQIAELTKALNAKKSVEEYRREIGAKKKKIKDDLDLIPARINEANRALPDDKDYSLIEGQIAEAAVDLESVESLLMNKTEGQKKHQELINGKIREVQDLRTRAQQIEFEETNATQDKKRSREQVILDKKRQVRTKQDEVTRIKTDHALEVKRKPGLETVAKDLRSKWAVVNAEKLEFKENEFSCPTCKRAYETTDIEAKKAELLVNFNKSKATRLADITERGKKVADDIKILDARIGNLASEEQGLVADLQKLQSDVATLEEEHIRLTSSESELVKEAITGNTEYMAIQDMIALRNEEINTPATDDDNGPVLVRKKELRAKIDELKVELSGKEQRTRILARITELSEQENKMSQELADLEGIEFAIEKFMKAKMDTLESRINGRFQLVRFKMFEEQINGGQVEACTTLINGVPYSDANTASKIQAGVDIINTLSKHYGVVAPIFIDNRESVINIPDSSSQIINLIVSEQHQKLTVGQRKQEMQVA